MKKILLITLLITSTALGAFRSPSNAPISVKPVNDLGDPHAWSGQDTIADAQEILGLPVAIPTVSAMPFPTPTPSPTPDNKETKETIKVTTPIIPVKDLNDALIHYQMKKFVQLKNYLDAIRAHFKANEAKVTKELIELYETFKPVESRVLELYPGIEELFNALKEKN